MTYTIRQLDNGTLTLNGVTWIYDLPDDLGALLAAAPEMFGLLTEASAWFADYEDDYVIHPQEPTGQLITAIRAAIAKATKGGAA